MRRLLAVAGPVLAAALLLAAVANAVRSFDDFPGVDFYHLWGIGLAHQSVPGDPYANTAQYSEALNRIATGTSSERLRLTNGWRRTIEPTGTPVFYALFDVLPRDYDTGYAIFYAVIFAALVAAVYAMGRMRGVNAWGAIALAALVSLTFNPFVQDIAHGNVTTLQLAGIVAAIAFARRPWRSRAPAVDLAFLPALALFVAFKPNTLLVAAALAVHYAVSRGPRRTLAGIAASVVALGTAWLAGAAFFGDAAVWMHWYGYTHGANGGTLLYSLDQENVSLAMMMAERSGTFGVYGYVLLLGAAFVLFFGAALTSLGKRVHGAGATLRRLLEDPWFAASIGVLFAFAMTPLMWSYYRMLALVPIFWLAFGDRRWDGATAWALLAYVFMARPLVIALLAHDMVSLVRLAALVGWLALIPAMCARLAAEARDAAGSLATPRRS